MIHIVRSEKKQVISDFKLLFASCLVIHILMICLFAYLGKTSLFIINILSVLFYVVGLFCVPKTKNIKRWYRLSGMEIILQQAVCNIVMGPYYGFGIFVIVVIPVMCFYGYEIYGTEVAPKYIVYYAFIAILLMLLSIEFGRGSNAVENIIDNDSIYICFVLNMLLGAMAVSLSSQKFLGEIKHNLIEISSVSEEIVHRANYDSLTGLYNRECFMSHVDKMLKDNPDKQFCIVSSDIKDFKSVNELFGENVGDEVLIMLAQIIRGLAGQYTVYGRVGGDCFALCMPVGLMNKDIIIDSINRIKMKFDSESYKIHIHVGIYYIGDMDESVTHMLDKAYVAINSIKNDYNKIIAVYDNKVYEDDHRRKEYLSMLDKAIDLKQFEIYLQPQTDRSGKLFGAEALIRWNHPRMGLLYPGAFVELYEETGVIHKLDRFVWEEAARQLKEWENAGRDDLYIAVNISTKDFFYIDIYEILTGLVKKYDIKPARLRLEITESAMAAKKEELFTIMDRLHEYGFIIEVDDFGSGYSSLNLLKDICADVIKIDKEFIMETANEGRSRSILEGIIQLTQKLGMSVLAEGVEDVKQIDMLYSLGCDKFQGYYFSKPIRVVDFNCKYGIYQQ